nr:hypothetical protein BaRGS_034685 [Batillaria attramentaria]
MMASDAWPEDIPIWVDDVQKWMTGLTRRTTCDDVIYALLYSRGQLETDSTEHYAVFERWRAVERPLQGRTKIVKVWAAWGAEQPNVQLIVRRLDDYFMPPGASNSRTRRRHRHSKGQRAKHLANCRCSGRSQCVRCGKLRALEHLVRHMVRQERRLQELQQRVQDTERQITEYETRMHVRRVQQDGRDYVQESYLEHDSPDSSSSSSEDPLDAVLLSVGEDRLDDLEVPIGIFCVC